MPLTFRQRHALKQRFYPDADAHAIGVVRAALERKLGPQSVILDAGASSGTWVLKRYASDVRFIVGADISIPTPQAGEERWTLPVVADLATLPFAPACFDLILCYNVIEHLADPAATFAEFARLLRPGGMLVFKAPALWSPLILASHLLPLSLHRLFKGRLGVDGRSVFPTHYRCNTPGCLHEALSAVGLRRQTLLTVDQTFDYLYFTRITFVLGLLYSRLTNLGPLRRLQNAIIGVYTKPWQVTAEGARETRSSSSWPE